MGYCDHLSQVCCQLVSTGISWHASTTHRAVDRSLYRSCDAQNAVPRIHRLHHVDLNVSRQINSPAEFPPRCGAANLLFSGSCECRPQCTQIPLIHTHIRPPSKMEILLLQFIIRVWLTHAGQYSRVSMNNSLPLIVSLPCFVVSEMSSGL